MKKIILMAVIAFIFVVLGSWFLVNYNSDKNFFISSIKEELKHEDKKILAYKVFPEKYNELCVWEGYRFSIEKASNALKKYKKFSKAMRFLKRHEYSEDRYLVFLINNKVIENQFILSSGLKVRGNDYGINFDDGGMCYYIDDVSFKIRQGYRGITLKME